MKTYRTFRGAVAMLGLGAVVVACGGSTEDEPDEPTVAETTEDLAEADVDAVCAELQTLASKDAAACDFYRLLGAVVSTRLLDEPTDEIAQATCQVFADECAAGLNETCPVREARELGCSVDLDTLTTCYEDRAADHIAAAQAFPPCSELTVADVMAVEDTVLRQPRSCDLVAFDCEQELDLMVEVAPPSDGSPVPRVCRDFQGVCGQCSTPVCEDAVRDCCGNAECTKAWAAYDACVTDRWDGALATYASVQEACRADELDGAAIGADFLYTCRKLASEADCYVQCPVFDDNR